MSIVRKALVLPFAICFFSSCATLTSAPQDIQTADAGSAEADGAVVASSQLSSPPIDEITVADRAIESPRTVQILTKSADASVAIAVETTASDERFVFNTGGVAQPRVDISRLENPSRLVVDIADAKLPSNKTFSAAPSNLVKSVRTGAHKGSARVVLDLTAPVKEVVNTQPGKVSIALSSTALPRAATTDSLASRSLLDGSDSTLSSSVRLTGLSLEAVPGQGTVVIADVRNLKDFEFQKTAPSEYVARITGGSIDPVAQQALLAAPNSGVIRSVRPTERDGDIMLRVFAQPTADLVALADGNRLVIRDNSLAAPDFRAQERVQPSLPSDPQSADMDPKAPSVTLAANEEKKPAEKAPVTATAPQDAITNDDLGALLGESQRYTGRLISLDLQDTDIDNALRIIAEVSNLNIIASSDVSGKVTLRLIDVPWDQALDVILKTNGLDKVQEGNVVRIAPVEKLRLEREALKQARLAEDELEPLSVKYVRVSYARAADLKPLIKSVLTERGDVAVDERSNQVIIKDIRKGLKNAVDMISKLDLRTPQVLLETQIIEANRSIIRDLGAQLGFSFIQSPETGNATGFNFPNSISVGGGIPGSTSASSFPAVINGSDGGSAISMIFGSADGTRSLDLNISALEREGRIRIVSRPSVATINNKAAEITSNEVIRVRKPNTGDTTVVGGQGGSDSDATEEIEVGITLRVTPQASPDYFVLMDIEAESSSFGSQVVDNIPSTIERRATSSVLVSSGQTFAIGGIYRMTDNDTVSGVPFLKDIPVLGSLFRRTLVNNNDEELLFFITPRIIEGSFDDAAMTASAS